MITNYTELQASVADWMDREDLVDRIPEFVQLAESRLNKTLRTADMEVVAYAYLDGGEAPVPLDFLEPRRIVSGLDLAAGAALQHLTPTVAGNAYSTGMAGTPRYYSIVDGRIYTYPNGGTGQITMTYYAKLPPLSEFGTNWLLTKWPDLYLFASLMEGAPFMGDDQRTATWGTLYQKAFDDAMASDQRMRWGGGVMRVAGATP
jgi:hypothetical protein